MRARGFTEGQVFYSEQGAAFTEAEEVGLSRQLAQRKFIDFLRNFRGDPSPGRTDGETVYRDRLDSDPPPKTLTVELEDLIAHDAELADALKKNPRQFVPLVRGGSCAARVGEPGPVSPLRGKRSRPASRARTRPSQLEEACADVLLSLRNELQEGEEPSRPEVQVYILSSQDATPIRALAVRTRSPAAPGVC